jgi:hypothetical protein
VVLVRILMSKSGFEDEVLVKLIVGIVKHVTIDIYYSYIAYITISTTTTTTTSVLL